MKNTGSTLLAIAAAAAVGAAFGVAYAPAKGEVTRKKLKKKINRAATDLKEYVDEQKDITIDKVSDLVESGKEKAQEIKGMVSSKIKAA